MIDINRNISSNFFFESAKKGPISENRYVLLKKIANCISKEYLENKHISINFICTHNSRRSQMAQAWTFFAIEYFKLSDIYTFSGGTEVTSFHRNTVKILQKSGFKFNVLDFSHQNPRYLITFQGTQKSILGFSKLYDHEINPPSSIIITTCESANQRCPNIDTNHKFFLPFPDPKAMDYTEFKLEKYSEINYEIAREIFIIFEKVAQIITK